MSRAASRHPLTLALMRTAVAIADEETVCLVESEGVKHAPDNTAPTWYDVRPLISEHEHSGELIDLHSARLAYGVARGLLVMHPSCAYLVRIARRRRPAL